jgi:hypothetical protein
MTNGRGICLRQIQLAGSFYVANQDTLCSRRSFRQLEVQKSREASAKVQRSRVANKAASAPRTFQRHWQRLDTHHGGYIEHRKFSCTFILLPHVEIAVWYVFRGALCIGAIRFDVPRLGARVPRLPMAAPPRTSEPFSLRRQAGQGEHASHTSHYVQPYQNDLNTTRSNSTSLPDAYNLSLK